MICKEFCEKKFVREKNHCQIRNCKEKLVIDAENICVYSIEFGAIKGSVDEIGILEVLESTEDRYILI